MFAFEKIYEVARDTPDDLAMVYNLERVSYRTFYRSICAMRRSLKRRNLRPGAVAVIFIETLPVAWTVDLALRTLGLTTVALRAASEVDGLGDLDVVALITLAGESSAPVDAGRLPGAQRIVVEPADWNAGKDDGVLEVPPTTPSGDHILLTSGTTGRYKMILVDAALEAANRAAGVDMYRSIDGLLQVEDRLGTVNLLGFGLWTAAGYNTPIILWAAGGAVVFHQGPDALRSLDVPGISHMIVTPAFLIQLAAAPPDAFRRNDALQLLTVGGALSMSLAERVKARLTRRIATTLGSTESGGWAMTPIETTDDLRWNRIHPSRVVQVVDEDDQPLANGALGQVRVLLDNGLTGYLNDPQATAAFFRNGYFYSGDLGIMDGQGRLALCGRVTDVLNVMGDKLASAPLEETLRDGLGVDSVCLLSEQSADSTEELHLVIETPHPIDPKAIQAAMPAELKAFPYLRVHFMDQLPRNHMGKIDRFKLKQSLDDRRRA